MDGEWECDLGPITEVRQRDFGNYRGLFPNGYRLHFSEGRIPSWEKHKELTPRRVIRERISLAHIGLED